MHFIIFIGYHYYSWSREYIYSRSKNQKKYFGLQRLVNLHKKSHPASFQKMPRHGNTVCMIRFIHILDSSNSNVWFIKIRTTHNLSLWLYEYFWIILFYGHLVYFILKVLAWEICNMKWGFAKKIIIKSKRQFMYGSNFYGSDVIHSWKTCTNMNFHFAK